VHWLSLHGLKFSKGGKLLGIGYLLLQTRKRNNSA
jgi:hypothetical protein